MDQKSEYAQAGVDYKNIEPFKLAMIEAGKKTVHFPERRGVFVRDDAMHAHGAAYEYRGNQPHIWVNTQEGLGNKNWIAECMYRETGDPHYFNIGHDFVLIIAHDVLAQGALPVIFTDEVPVGNDKWFTDKKRSEDLANGIVDICKQIGVAMPAGESPALRFLLKSEPPVEAAPSLSGCVTGIVAPSKRFITGAELRPGDHILATPSTGLGANGISLVIKRALSLPEAFMTKLSDGRTLGEHALIPTREYVTLIEAMLDACIDIHALLPATGSGVSKIAYDDRPYTYIISDWVKEIPLLFRYMRELGVNLVDCLTTFNWGVGYYIYLPAEEVERAIEVADKAGYQLLDIGVVKEGKREVIFEPESLTLPPPGE